MVRILVVDNFEHWRRAIVGLIEEDPTLKVTHALSDGLSALRMCAELRPDLVVLDVGLPKLNGLETARRIREASPETKILFLSAIPSQDVQREALRIGAAGYIVKNTALRNLLPAVRAALAGEELLQFTILSDTLGEVPEE